MARHRTVRWLDRCIIAHKRTDKQNLFPIVQGGLDENKRKQCANELIERDTPGQLRCVYNHIRLFFFSNFNARLPHLPPKHLVFTFSPDFFKNLPTPGLVASKI